jgi:hypothetical protein
MGALVLDGSSDEYTSATALIEPETFLMRRLC